MNVTFIVGTLFHCHNISVLDKTHKYDPLWRQTSIGCDIIEVLQDIYKFNVTYLLQSSVNGSLNKDRRILHPRNDDSIDIYGRPMSYRQTMSLNSFAITSVTKWRFGFILKSPNQMTFYFQSFYGRPFTRSLWGCLCGMAFIICILLYYLKCWELRILGSGYDYGFSYEMLMVVGAYCQHIPPVYANLASRRTAYFIFFVFSYIIYSFYTSNLLSHLVNDEDHGIGLEALSQGDYEIAVTHDIKLLMDGDPVCHHKNFRFMKKTLMELRSVTIHDGLRRVKEGRTALLSDYMSLFSVLKTTYDVHAICKLIKIDLVSNVMKYLFVSKNFTYKEEFKIGMLRAKESGLVSRIIHKHHDLDSPLDCKTLHHAEAKIHQLYTPICVLLAIYLCTIIIVVGERIYFTRRFNLWPYFE